MDKTVNLLQALSPFAWPVLIAIVVFRFRHLIQDLLETARSRKVTVKVAGSELTMDEATDQQRLLIKDLQMQIIALRRSLRNGAALPSVDAVGMEVEHGSSSLVLWVDDNPKNNAIVIADLVDSGFNVETAHSTVEALEKFDRKPVGFVVTDLGRIESGRYNAEAGIELIRAIKQKEPRITPIVYTNMRDMVHSGGAAMEAGAGAVTASPTILLSLFGIGE